RLPPLMFLVRRSYIGPSCPCSLCESCESTLLPAFVCFFFFNDPATTEIYTLSLHDALPIFDIVVAQVALDVAMHQGAGGDHLGIDRKSTRLNSSHDQISYAVFCLKKKKKKNTVQSDSIKLPSDTLPTDRIVSHISYSVVPLC